MTKFIQEFSNSCSLPSSSYTKKIKSFKDQTDLPECPGAGNIFSIPNNQELQGCNSQNFPVNE